ncbi:MAG: hypothetical protein EPO68_00570 [Planctomycetota bacterium]|nr:MAG: hypothetical protein EPO68_00570 [Planctomycetota bacterium]
MSGHLELSRRLHERLGRIGPQPIEVASYTNRRFTVNWRVPLDHLRRVLPASIEPDEVPGTGQGMLSMCACDFHVVRLGWLPVPPIQNNDMLCRISARIRRHGRTLRAYYTLRSDSSSHLLGWCGRRFSHFRKQISRFCRREDATSYALECEARDPLGSGRFEGRLDALSKQPPATSAFADADAATRFVFELDGSCGYDWGTRRLSFQRIEYPDWDVRFCHASSWSFALIEHLAASFELPLELDCVLHMHDTPQVWGRSSLYAESERDAPGWMSAPRAARLRTAALAVAGGESPSSGWRTTP